MKQAGYLVACYDEDAREAGRDPSLDWDWAAALDGIRLTCREAEDFLLEAGVLSDIRSASGCTREPGAERQLRLLPPAMPRLPGTFRLVLFHSLRRSVHDVDHQQSESCIHWSIHQFGDCFTSCCCIY